MKLHLKQDRGIRIQVVCKHHCSTNLVTDHPEIGNVLYSIMSICKVRIIS